MRQRYETLHQPTARYINPYFKTEVVGYIQRGEYVTYLFKKKKKIIYYRTPFRITAVSLNSPPVIYLTKCKCDILTFSSRAHMGFKAFEFGHKSLFIGAVLK